MHNSSRKYVNPFDLGVLQIILFKKPTAECKPSFTTELMAGEISLFKKMKN